MSCCSRQFSVFCSSLPLKYCMLLCCLFVGSSCPPTPDNLMILYLTPDCATYLPYCIQYEDSKSTIVQCVLVFLSHAYHALCTHVLTLSLRILPSIMHIVSVHPLRIVLYFYRCRLQRYSLKHSLFDLKYYV